MLILHTVAVEHSLILLKYLTLVLYLWLLSIFSERIDTLKEVRIFSEAKCSRWNKLLVDALIVSDLELPHSVCLFLEEFSMAAATEINEVPCCSRILLLLRLWFHQGRLKKKAVFILSILNVIVIKVSHRLVSRSEVELMLFLV